MAEETGTTTATAEPSQTTEPSYVQSLIEPALDGDSREALEGGKVVTPAAGDETTLADEGKATAQPGAARQNALRLFSRPLANFNHSEFIRITVCRNVDSVSLRGQPKVATRHFVGIVHAQLHNRTRMTNTRILDMHVPRTDVCIEH